MRRFELDGEPRRFWEVGLMGSRVQMRWGVVGTPGQAFSRGFESEADAEVFAERQVIAQRERGYVESTRVQAPAALAPEVIVERHQRFEDPSSYMEITQEGVKVTMRGGRIVNGRDVVDREQLHVQHHTTVASATDDFEARCAGQQARGARLVEPEPTHAVHTSAELEAQCEASRDEPDAWTVYADWLIAHGDARGEIAALQQAGKLAEARRVLGTHLRDLCGTDTGKLAFEFRHGFAIGCTITVADDELLEDVTHLLLASPMGRFLESLRFGLAGAGNENDWGPTIHAVAKSPRAAHIRALRFDHYDTSDSEISWTPYGDFSGVWSRLPALEHLHIRSGAGGTLGAIDLPNLRTFIRESGGLSHAEIEQIVAARWPALEHLEIWFGSQTYGAEGELSALKPIFAGTGLPALRHLGIVNCELVEDVIPELARSAILPRLRTLDLSKGILARAGAAALVAEAAAFRHLTTIDVNESYLNADELAQIQAILPSIVSTTQRDRGEDHPDHDDMRFAAVGE